MRSETPKIPPGHNLEIAAQFLEGWRGRVTVKIVSGTLWLQHERDCRLDRVGQSGENEDREETCGAVK